MTATLDRTAFVTSRLVEFFTEKELTMQIGYEIRQWPIALTKELIDNALDACETAGIPPQVTVTLDEDALTVEDNGPGLPVATLEKSLDYLVRVSTNAHYVSPTRGQLGNALKTIRAAPFVVDGHRGCVAVVTGGVRHMIEVTLDRISQAPIIDHRTTPDARKTGTLVRMHWPEIARSIEPSASSGFYKRSPLDSLILAYRATNPHASFALQRPGCPETVVWPATDPGWKKWPPNAPTSPHWYAPEQFRNLIAAYLADERAGGRSRTVRDFVSEFAGLSGSTKPKRVCLTAGLDRARLNDLQADGDVDMNLIECLLHCMQRESREIKPSALGAIGRVHLTKVLVNDYGVDADSIDYKKVEDFTSGDPSRPFVIEVMFGVRRAEDEHLGCEVVSGVNWAPALSPPGPYLATPFRRLPSLLAEPPIDRGDPVVLLVHAAQPGLQFTDRGKGQLA